METFRVVLTGNAGVGKTSLFRRYARNMYEDPPALTTFWTYEGRVATVGGVPVRMQVWDTAGQERFGSLTRMFYRGAGGVLIVYDPFDRASFSAVRELHETVKCHASQDCVQMLVSTKADLPPTPERVPDAEAQVLADELGVTLMHTSARTSEGVEAAFLTLAAQVLGRPRAWSTTRSAWCAAVARAVHARHFKQPASWPCTVQ